MRMDVGQILQTLVLGPIELLLDVIFAAALRITASPGLSIVVLSLAVNLLLLPLYRRADAMQQAERDRALRMKPRIDQIKEAFTGNERFMILQTYYRQNRYKPYYALKGSVSLLLQVPFFMAAYGFLSGLGVLQGVSFGPIRDLGAPDGLLRIGGMTVHLLPVLMTAVNIVSGVIYSRGMPLKSRIQMYGLALIFLVLLYRSPAGLVFYWTLNNLFSLVKNAVRKLPFFRGRGAAVGKPESARLTPSLSRGVFLVSCVFLTLLTGLLIPSEVIRSSTAEFLNIRHMEDPRRYLLSSSLLAAGTFLVWCGVYFSLAGSRARRVLARVFAAACAAGALDFAVFGRSYGDMSALMVYGRSPSAPVGEQLLNGAAVLAAAALVVWLIRVLPGLARAVLAACCAALLAMSVMNMSAIREDYRENEAIAEAGTGPAPEIHLSSTGRNVVVIMLDRAVGGFVPFLMNEKSELREQFAGFTYYPNTLSFGFHTNVGSPPLYGGYEYTPDGMAARTDMLLVEKHNEALKVMPVLFLENGFDVTVIDPSLANYQWIPDLSIYDDYPEIHGFIAQGYYGENAEEVLRYTDEVRNRNLFCYSLFRISPVILHRTLYNDGYYLQTDTAARSGADPYSLAGVNPDFLKNYWVMEKLSDMTKVTADSADCFLMLATEETHDVTDLQEPDYVPRANVDNTAWETEHGIRTAADGSTLDVGGGGQFLQSHYQCNMAAFLQLGRWFDNLRKWGVWDNTRIIVVSDHAYDMNGLGFDLADKYPGMARESAVNGEDWTKTSGYEPVLMMKDFGDTEFRTDRSFMTNADTPVLALGGIVENPVNPFTGNPITSDAKYAGELHLIETDWHFANNNGTYFSDVQTITFRNDDITDIRNWTIEDWEAED